MLMPFMLRVVLIIAAVLTLVWVLRKIRHSQMSIDDGIFWFFFVLFLLLMAIFPQIAYFFAGLLGIESTANFVFLAIVAILLIKEFFASLEIAKLKAKLSQLAQDEALNENEDDKVS